MNKMIGVLITVLLGVEIAGIIQTNIATSTGTGGVFENTSAGTILALVPLVFVVGLLAVSFWKKS